MLRERVKFLKPNVTHICKNMCGVAFILGAMPFLSSCDWANANNFKTILNEDKKIPVDVPLQMWGKPEQSATIIGKTTPLSDIDAAGIKTRADQYGYFVFGFDRDAPKTATIVVTTPQGDTKSRVLNIETRNYDVTEVNGLPQSTVTPPQSLQEKISQDQSIKQIGLISRDGEIRGFLQAFEYPLKKVRVTSQWGAQRSLNGNLQQPHYGVDLGAPLGTPIYAPADGKVVIAQSGMHIEGGMVALDHGQGLISMYLHQKKIIVTNGQLVKKGEKIGEVGAEGRASGPHLCWRMRWRWRQLDPSTLIGPQPEIILTP